MCGCGGRGTAWSVFWGGGGGAGLQGCWAVAGCRPGTNGVLRHLCETAGPTVMTTAPQAALPRHPPAPCARRRSWMSARRRCARTRSRRRSTAPSCRNARRRWISERRRSMTRWAGCLALTVITPVSCPGHAPPTPMPAHHAGPARKHRPRTHSSQLTGWPKGDHRLEPLLRPLNHCVFPLAHLVAGGRGDT